MDDIDIAQAQEEWFRSQALQKARRGRTDIYPTGHCWNCEEEVDHPRLFCDKDCERDHARRSLNES